jgi:hypothetical protein
MSRPRPDDALDAYVDELIADWPPIPDDLCVQLSAVLWPIATPGMDESQAA